MGERLHIVHIVFRFDYGGLENGLVNLINNLPTDSYRHTVIALSEATDIQLRIKQPSTEVICIGKKPGQDFASYLKLARTIRKLKPDIVHSRNFGTLDCHLWTALSRCARIHGEHGWDVHDPDGENKKYQRIRRVLFRLVDRIVPLSEDLERWLLNKNLSPPNKLVRICNGVDCQRFQVKQHQHSDEIVIGAVTRLSEIKDPMSLLRAFNKLTQRASEHKFRLLIVGDGPLRNDIERYLKAENLNQLVELAGDVLDVQPYLQRMDIFVQSSKGEGISNTILEAMASGLAVVATNVGGNSELIADGETGALVDYGCEEQLADGLAQYLRDPELRAQHGQNARKRCEAEFSLTTMVNRYHDLYQSVHHGEVQVGNINASSS